MPSPVKKKIAILSLHPYNYGGVLSLLKVAYGFCQQYFEPTIFFVGFDQIISTSIRHLKMSSSSRPEKYFDMNCFEIGARWAFWEPGHYAFTRSSWKKALAGYDYFFVASGTPIAAHPLALLNKRYCMWICTPYDDDRAERVKRMHGVERLLNAAARPWMHHIERTTLSKAGHIFALSTYAADQFKQRAPITEHRTSLCGFPIPYEKISFVDRSAATRKRGIIALGRFDDPRKNCAMLISVFNQLYAHDPSLQLYVVGKAPSEEEINQWRHLPSFNNISFTGYVREDEKEYYFSQSDIMLITSYQEGLSIVGLEAMAHGLPVVSTDCGGPRDFIEDGVNGYLVGIHDEEKMVERVLYLLNDTHAYEAMRRNARQTIERSFSYSAVYKQFKKGLVSVYPELQQTFDHFQVSGGKQ